MKTKYFITFVLILNLIICFAQIKVYPEIYVASTAVQFGTFNSFKTQEIDYKRKFHYSDFEYVGVNSSLGFRVQTKNFSYALQADYLWAINGLFFYLNKSSTRKSNLIGLKQGIRFFEKRIIKPRLNFEILTEVTTNYKNRKISYDAFSPTDDQTPGFSEVEGHGISSKKFYTIKLYQSTPLMATIYGGCDFKLVDNLYLNASIGYNLTLLKYKYIRFQYDNHIKENYKDKIADTPVKSVLFHSMAFQLGLSYAFSFHKKDK